MRKALFGVALLLLTILATPVAHAASSPCGLSAAAFCDTFDAPAGNGNRSGDLNGTVWGVSRRGQEAAEQGMDDEIYSTQLDLCGTTVTVMDPRDIQICQGHVAEALNDGGGCCAGGAAAVFMYPKQPFDIAGRTGTVVFDVSNDTQGGHAAWPEFWYTSTPAPVPFGSDPVSLNPQNGLGLKFFQHCTADDGSLGWNVGEADITRNYDMTYTQVSGGDAGVDISLTGCVTMGSAAKNTMNHVELRINGSKTAVYATDAFPVGGSVPALQHIADVTYNPLPLSRGVIWVGDGHYNACKAPGTQCVHTFYWDNVGFDGPVLPQDRTFDVLDAQGPHGPDGGLDMGWNYNESNGTEPVLHTLPVDSTSLANAQGALLTFNAYSDKGFSGLHVLLNGHALTAPVDGPTEETFAVPVPLSDIVTGPNAITFPNAGFDVTIFNVDVVLLGAGSASPPPPTPTPVPPTPTPVPPTPAPTPQPINGVPCTVTLNGVQQTGTCSGTFLPA